VAQGTLMNWVIEGFGYLFTPANWTGPGGLWERLVQHIGLSTAAVLIACVLAVPVGLWLGHVGRGGAVAINVGNVGRAVPTLAAIVLLFLAPPPLGPSTTSVIVALVMFCIPPLLTNTYVGMREVDRDTVEAATGMGMSSAQLLRQVEVPLAAPLILNGVRLAAVQAVATATIAGVVGGGGLGRVINSAFVAQDSAKLVAGAVLVTALALSVEAGLAILQRRADVRWGAERPATRTARESRSAAATSA
jgi:osmoprotectant transport system permease protein